MLPVTKFATHVRSDTQMGFQNKNTTGLFVVAKLWILMASHNVIPPEGGIKHLLFTLYFLNAYPKQAAVCSMVVY
jgi:hypothetical protein